MALLTAATVIVSASTTLLATPAGAEPLASCKFGVGQVFDTQWFYNQSSQVLSVSGLTIPWHEAGGQIQGLQQGDYFQFVDKGSSFGLNLYNSSGGFKETVTGTGSFVAAGPGFVFYNQLPNGNGTLFTTQNSYRYGDSATLQATVSNPSYDYMKNQFGSCSAAPIAGGGTQGGTAGGTPPSISVTRSPAANAHGWNNTPVSLTFSVTGATSTSGCGPFSFGHGTNITQTCSATNTGGTVTRSEIVRVDTAPPTVAGSIQAAPNASGWYTGDVPVTFSCADSLSGVLSCTGNATISGEGTNRTITGLGVDRAGNAASAVAGPVDIDRTAPVTTAGNPTSWQQGTVEFDLAPADGLSGVASTFFQVDDAAPVTDSLHVTVSGEGIHTVTFGSTDVAGNVEQVKIVEVKVDDTAPFIAHAIMPLPNADGWNNSPATVSFECADALSGVALCSAPTTVSDDATAVEVTGTAKDLAGNTATDTAFVNLDQVAPSVTHDITPSANDAGWQNSAVTVGFSCSDDRSGVATCADAVTLGEGADQTVTGSATDVAGNSGSSTASGIDVDLTPPTITGAATTLPNDAGWYKGAVTVHFDCGDALSGVASCPADVTLTETGAGQSVSGTVVDHAGNTASYTVEGINIDADAPAITGAATSAPNAGGWYSGDVVIDWTCSDELSGVVECPADSIVDGEGDDLVAAASVFDAAGNATTATVSGINIDRTTPAITGAVTTQPNSAGWYNGAVTVRWTCSDALSRVATCPADTVLAGEGAGQSVSATVADLAGNTTTAVVAGINIDRTGPASVIDSAVTSALKGWPLQVTGDATDNLSGVTKVQVLYTRIGTNAKITKNALCGDCPGLSVAWRQNPTTSPGPGLYSARARVTDVAGNVTETATAITIAV